MAQPKNIAEAETSTPLARYEALCANGTLTHDDAQLRLMHKLDGLFKALTHTEKRRFWHLFRKPTRPGGMYIWGDVGRGKSMAMDIFVDVISMKLPTKRVHFHAFMLDVHKRLHAFRSVSAGSDVMPQLITQLAGEHAILCLDEFQVHDVTDAAILARLFGGLLEAGICVIFTSNRAPHALYPNGLQREQFLRFVDEVVMARMEIVQLDSPEDYRLKQLASFEKTYIYPRNLAADEHLLGCWQTLTHNATSVPLGLEVQGRILRIDKHVNGIAWLTFAELCMRPLGASDYLEITRVIHTLILQGIPALSPEQRNEAKRFVTLIDTLYDHKIKCIFSAETPPEGIYAHGYGSFEFARTVSRLHEMQSTKYLAGAKC